jgi:hypothetical protein
MRLALILHSLADFSEAAPKITQYFGQLHHRLRSRITQTL